MTFRVIGFCVVASSPLEWTQSEVPEIPVVLLAHLKAQPHHKSTYTLTLRILFHSWEFSCLTFNSLHANLLWEWYLHDSINLGNPFWFTFRSNKLWMYLNTNVYMVQTNWRLSYRCFWGFLSQLIIDSYTRHHVLAYFMPTWYMLE